VIGESIIARSCSGGKGNRSEKIKSEKFEIEASEAAIQEW
jgi:hypothetical protein